VSTPHSASLWTLRLAELRDLTASASPTPGGGSVACVAAALGTSLLIMAAKITSKSAQERAALDAWLADAGPNLDALSAHADRDVEVFERYMAAAALPRATDDEKAARKAALAAAALAAAEAPLAAGRDMVRALELGLRLARLTKKSVASDVLGGADLLSGAVLAALRNVDVNLPAIAGEAEQKRLALEAAALTTQADALARDIRAALAAPVG